ncbi:thiol reductant ABC exporter subunit CydD [Rhodobacter ferrooxidans]|uniref:ABC transporter, CydDC cysteine exporter (CydDC-E) family, permease/ATP-binding protein CydD n=1 Tax=Rhodobacter ferrooxidans TaxID=371731 RepID=C8S4G4_9RHOB|nr:thiol reductant ABC exporter subunit CydD [Rhodobacter sp. SW2]EEW24131.1 ABC transporter, CydDC cysteine exporter (CydDC-E) family, permease/ATP-binding protein CydD [Rhodobacter sp. SW2]
MDQNPKQYPVSDPASDPLLAPGRRRMRRAAVLSVLAGLLWPVQAAVVAWAVGGLLTGADASALKAVLLFGGVGLLRVVLGYGAEAQAQAAARAVVTAARARIVATEAARTGESGFGGAGSLTALAVEKLDLLAPYVTRYAPARARVMVLPLVILALAFWQSWAVGLVLLVSGPLIPVFMALIGLAAKEASARQMAEIGTLNDFLVERLSALVDIRLLGAGDAVLGSFAAQAGDLRRRTMAVLRVAFLSSTVLELFAAIGVAMVAVYVGFSLLGALEFGAWGGAVSPEAGIFLLLLAPEFYQPLRDLSAAWHDKAAADAVLDEMAAWQDEPRPALPGTGGPAAHLAGPASIALHDCVTPSGRALPAIAIAAGERVALVGGSGAGKTTVLRLMAGLELPDQGRVIVAGQPLTAANADGWRARLGWMPQAPHFLTASLRQNLTLGRAGDLEAALRTAGIADAVAALPQGLATRLGETGAGLSGGEARRITLARAVFGAPDVILADEPTADLDAATAQIVADGLLAEAARGATLVVATHDRALAAQMDRVIDLGHLA